MTTQKSAPPRLGMLMCGHSPDAIVAAYGRYDRAFSELLGPESYNYQVYNVVDSEFPGSVDEADAWLLTGSKHGAYDDLPWIAPLEQFVRTVYDKNLPLVGICFGHQLMAQALGGHVEKFEGGWIAGTQHYDFNAETGLGKAVLNAWHQDQVIDKPEQATVIGSSDGCQIAALQYRPNTVSLQPHPEFDNDYLALLLEHRGKALPSENRQMAADSLGQDLSRQSIAKWLNRVLTTPA